MLTPKEIKRYSRQILLPEVGMEGQQKLKASSVLLVGVGGLGSPVLQYLAAAGVGKIGIIDFDMVDETNLHRQVIYSTNEVGTQKVYAARKKMEQANLHVEIVAINKKLDVENALDIFAHYDLVVDCSDNFNTKYLTNDACVILNKPLVFGSIYRFQGQVSVFNYNNGPTYRCLFPERSDRESCSDAGVLGVLPGIIGCFMANEVIKILLNFGDILSGKLLVIDSKSLSIQIHNFSLLAENRNIKELTPSSMFCSNEIEASNLNELQDALYLIDVREPDEHIAYNIGGINIPLSVLQEDPGQLDQKILKGKKIIFYCKTGVRSKKAVIIAQSQGIKNSLSLRGGIDFITKTNIYVKYRPIKENIY
jgi:sulfur-carrier protein adenylyltransferase/sulfurtransferase